MGLFDKFTKKKEDVEDFEGEELGLPKAKFPGDDLFGGLGPKPSPFDTSSKDRDHELILAKLDTINHRLDSIERRLGEIERIAKQP